MEVEVPGESEVPEESEVRKEILVSTKSATPISNAVPAERAALMWNRLPQGRPNSKGDKMSGKNERSRCPALSEESGVLTKSKPSKENGKPASPK